MKNLLIIFISILCFTVACTSKDKPKASDNEEVKLVEAEIEALSAITSELDSTKLKIELKESELDELLNDIDF